MNVQWFSKCPKGVAKIYDNNITLNTVAANHFKNAYGIIVGFATDTKTLLLKSISKEEVANGLYKDLDIHNIAIKPSYGRISGKSMINRLIELFPINFSSESLNKYECEWNDDTHSLAIYLERRYN